MFDWPAVSRRPSVIRFVRIHLDVVYRNLSITAGRPAFSAKWTSSPREAQHIHGAPRARLVQVGEVGDV